MGLVARKLVFGGFATKGDSHQSPQLEKWNFAYSKLRYGSFQNAYTQNDFKNTKKENYYF